MAARSEGRGGKARAAKGGGEGGKSGKGKKKGASGKNNWHEGGGKKDGGGGYWAGSGWDYQGAWPQIQESYMWWNGTAEGSGEKSWASVAAKAPAQKGKGDAKDEANVEDAGTTDNLLDALAPSKEAAAAAGAKAKGFQTTHTAAGAATMQGAMTPEKLLGHWVDSLGNAVHVLNTDAYDVRLSATLTKPPRPDIHLSVKPVIVGGGWQCGHSLLDPVWTTETQLHWVSMDGRVSVWVRPDTAEDEAKDKAAEEKPAEAAEGAEAAAEAAEEKKE